MPRSYNFECKTCPFKSTVKAVARRHRLLGCSRTGSAPYSRSSDEVIVLDELGQSTVETQTRHECEELGLLENMFMAGAMLGIPIGTLTLSWDEYRANYNRPDVLDVQLAVNKASPQDILAFPAKMTRKDSVFYFPWVEAGNNFRMQAVGTPAGGQAKSTILRVNFNCSQETLHALVTSIYLRHVLLTADNVSEILALADFLQAQWLIDSVLHHVSLIYLEHDPVAVFRLGQAFAWPVIIGPAVSKACALGATEIKKLLHHSQEGALSTQLQIVKAMTVSTQLPEILELIATSVENGGWHLGVPHLNCLKSGFPERAGVLDLLFDPTATSGHDIQHDARHLRLASNVVRADLEKDNARWPYSLEWNIPMPIHGRSLQCRPFLEASRGRKFTLTAELGRDGTWGVTFNPAQPWGKEIVRLRTESNGPKTSLYTFSASKQQLPGRQVACSVPRVISDWSTARSGGFVVNGFLRLIIEAKDE